MEEYHEPYINILMTHRPYTSENIGHNYSSIKLYKQKIDKNPDFDIVRNEERFRKTYERLCVE